MAVVQISRIQIRRGQANGGTGFPQLASGELGWAIDAQQLYIGNGAVSEGSPAVGNTKILTQNDLTGTSNLLQQVQHIYRVNDTTITTGADANNPVSRYLQARLDDQVSTTDFGTIGDGTTNDTVALQRAINQLFLNATTPAYAATNAGASKRVVLQMPAGVFKTKSTLYIPSYATLVGAGKEKTTIYYDPSYTITGTSTTGVNVLTTISAATSMIGATVIGSGIPLNTTVSNVSVGVSISLSNVASSGVTGGTFTIIPVGPAIQFVNDSSTIGNPSTLSSTLGSNQPRRISLKGLSVRTPTGVNTCLQLDAVKDSVFEDLNLQCDWSTNYNLLSRGIFMQALSAIVTCEGNVFKGLTFTGCTFGVWAKQDIRNNIFEDCYFTDGYQGLALGVGANGTIAGQQYGPRETTITNCKFYNIKRHAVYLELGAANTTRDCKYINVGCNGGGNTSAQYPQVYFKVAGNTSQNDYSDRHTDLSTYTSLTSQYIPEVSGHATYTLQGVRQVGISYVTNNSTFGFRLPCGTDQYGVPVGSVTHSIDYFYKTNSTGAGTSFTRKGTIIVTADVVSATVQLSDEFNFAGTDTNENHALGLNFTASFFDSTGAIYTGAVGQTPYSIGIYYTNTLTSDTGNLIYSYTTSV